MWRRTGFVAVLFVVGCVLLASFASTARANEANVSCGKPKQAGSVKVKVTVKKPNPSGIGETTEVIEWTATVTADDTTADLKADRIRSAGPGGDSRIEAPTRDGNTVKTKSKNGWTIKAIEFQPDNTKEEENYNVFALFLGNHAGLVSFSGTATGTAVGGGAGLVRVTVNGQVVTVSTSTGQSATSVESALITGLSSAGISAHVATAADLAAFPGSGGDGHVVYIQPPYIASGGLKIRTDDSGLALDEGGLLDLAPVTVPGVSSWSLVAMFFLLAGAGALAFRRRVGARGI